MAASKKKVTSKMVDRLIFSFLVIFPLGQIIRVSFNLLGISVTLQPVDAIAGVLSLIYLVGKYKPASILKHISSFLAVAGFSLIFSLTIFDTGAILIGIFYLLRLIAYTGFFTMVWIYARNKKVKTVLFNSLIAISLTTAIFGWAQYLRMPNLVFLKLIGWDDHLYRLAGTFLDPGFTGIILVLGFLLSLKKYLSTRQKVLFLTLIILLVSIAFTYSRASYLALFSGVLVIIFLKKSKKVLAFLIPFFLLIALLLPRPSSEGVLLERTSSIYAKFENYSQTLQVIKKYPVFGVGYNNLCLARLEMFGGNESSHACSGSDSSLLMIIATTGVVGLIAFLNMAVKIIKSVSNDFYGQTFLASSGALFTHSLFVNSLFYPWVMGWMGILLALSLKDSEL